MNSSATTLDNSFVRRISSPGRMLYAGYGSRLAAAIIDSILLGMLIVLVTIITLILLKALAPQLLIRDDHRMINWIISTIISGLYYGFFYSKFGASPGKSAMGLIVVEAESGKNLSLPVIILRELVCKPFSYILMGGGLFMILFRADRSALHDIFAYSSVVRKPAPAQKIYKEW